MTENPNKVHLRPTEEDNGAEKIAPKNAPACKTETTLAEMSLDLLLFTVPSALMIPKCDWK